MVAVPNFRTKSAAPAGATVARIDNGHASAAAAATAKSFPDIRSPPLFWPTVLPFGRFAWWRDYKATANPAKGMFDERDTTTDYDTAAYGGRRPLTKSSN